MDFFAPLLRRFPFLFWATVSTALLLLPSLAMLVLDTRTLAGVSLWRKAINFEISIVIFNLTIAWLLLHLNLPVSLARATAFIVALSMLVEIFAITFQAARAVPSH